MKEGIAGSLYLILIGTLILLSGLVFTWLLGSSFQRAKGMDQWRETKCFILESEVRTRRIGPEVPTDYRLGILFGYEMDGKSYTSDNHDLRGNAWVKDPERVRALIANYPAGTEQTCWVNPENPEQAVLKKETKAPGYSIWFPILFVVGGLGVILKALAAIWRARSRSGSQPEGV